MAEFEMKCPHCGTTLAVQDDWRGLELECPECKQLFVLPRSGADPDTKPCPFCGAVIKSRARRCRFCKRDLAPRESPPEKPSVGEKSAAPAGKKRKMIFIIAAAVAILIIAGSGIFFLSGERRFIFPDAIAERENLMLQALDFYISEQKKPADEAFLNQIKEKAGKTNNPDLLLPVAMMELKAGRKEQALAALREGIACGSGGCVYYAFRTEIAGFAPVKKAVEIKFWPVIVKAGFNIKIVALARNKELSPAQSEVVTLCDDFLKTTERVELSIKGNMGSARGSFLIFEDKICYFPANKENPDNVTVNGKKWKNLAFPFSLNKKVYPCMVGKAEINNINHHHFWRDSISIYPKSDSDFEMTAVLVKK